MFTLFAEHTTIVAVYVDDLILITDASEVMQETKRVLSEQFDMGLLHYCLGVSVVYEHNCVWLHQKRYILQMFKSTPHTHTACAYRHIHSNFSHTQHTKSMTIPIPTTKNTACASCSPYQTDVPTKVILVII